MNWIKRNLIPFVLLFLLGAQGIAAQDSSRQAIAEDMDQHPLESAKAEILYQCQLHPEIISNIPNYCTRCELRLKEYTMAEAIANLNELSPPLAVGAYICSTYPSCHAA